MSATRNLIGMHFGSWTVLRRGDPPIAYTSNGRSKSMWECVCKCGHIQTLGTNHLNNRSGPRSCRKCSIKTSNGDSNDVTGRVFGTWSVLNRVGTRGEGDNRKSLWLCKCVVCGSEREIVRSNFVIAAGGISSTLSLDTDTLGLGSPAVCQVCSAGRKTEYLQSFIGRQFGTLTIKSVQDTGSAIVECSCTYTETRDLNNLVYSAVDNTTCSECRRRNYEEKSKEPIEAYMCQIRRAAEERNLEFAVDATYLLQIFDGQCAISGVQISLGGRGTRGRDTRTASLDRIDSSKAYIPGNVQWTHKVVNIMKMDLDEVTFLFFCNKIATNFPM